MIEPLPPPSTKDAATSPIIPPAATGATAGAAAAVTPASSADGAPSSPPSASPAPGPSVPQPQDKSRKKKMSDEEILEKLRKATPHIILFLSELICSFKNHMMEHHR